MGLRCLIVGIGLLFLAGQPQSLQAQNQRIAMVTPSADEALPDLYYATGRSVTVFSSPDSTRPYFELRLREPVEVLDGHERWVRIRTEERATGYVPKELLSNTWIRVSKRSATVYLYEGDRQVMAFPADFGRNAFADKVRQGGPGRPDHWRTPDGVFFVAAKNARSQFYKALVLNYPNAEDAERGLQEGWITNRQYDAILKAEATFGVPPMNTPLGGWIEIHGEGTGARSNWTQGCVAIQNAAMDRLWSEVHVGTPIVVDP